MTKEEYLNILKTGNPIYNHVWWFKMRKNGSVFGGCVNPDCCQIDYDTFEDMWTNYDLEGWHD